MDRDIRKVAHEARVWVESSRYVLPNQTKYLRWIDEFEDYALACGAKELCPELVDEWSDLSEKLSKNRDQYLWRMRGARLMCDIAGVKASAFDDYGFKTPRRTEVPARFAKEHGAYTRSLESSGASASTIKVRRNEARLLLSFLGDRIDGLSDLSIEDLDAYMSKRASELGENSLVSCRASVRRFLAFLLESSDYAGAMDGRLPLFLNDRHKSPPKKLQLVLSDEEVAAMLDAARSMRDPVQHPRRTFLIVVMLAQYMMRTTDLCKMTLDDIDWAQGTIVVRSVKSGGQRVFPLTESVRYAIIDYLKNERPQASHRYLITQARYPHGPLKSSGGILCVLRRVGKEAGVEVDGRHFGGHALRRAGATALMNEDVPYSVISTILQHDFDGSNASETTMSYLGVDIKRLRTAALEVPCG